MNPADDSTFTRPLAKALQHHVDAIAAGVTGLPQARTSTEDAGPRGQIAAAWVYASVLVAWAEDHRLIDPWVRAGARERRDGYLTGSSDGARGWLARAVRSLAVHPSTWCLLDPRYTAMRDGRLPEKPVADLLDWWSDEAPSLAYPTPDTGPDSLSGWIPGDLLQHLSGERRKRNALVQTPWWVADFILDLTLRPAAAEFTNTTLRVIDPTCGTGHFMIRAVDLLWSLYTTGDMPASIPNPIPIVGWTPVGPDEAARRILAGLHGVELDPLTAAVARLRVTVAVADRLARAKGARRGPRLDEIPQTIRPGIIVGDALLLGNMPWEEYRRLYGPARGDIAAIYDSETHIFGACSWPDRDVPDAVIQPRTAVRIDRELVQGDLFEVVAS